MKQLLKILLSCMIGLLMACAGDKTGIDGLQDTGSGTSIDTNRATDSVRLNFRKLVKALPVPFDILEKFSGANLPYRENMTNAPNSASNYPDARSQAINLGIYGADLAYMISQDKLAESAPYLKAIRKLSDALVGPSAFDQGFLDRYANNQDQKDSLQSLVNTSYDRIDQTLQDNERFELASLVIYGGWLESVYITTQHIGDQSQNEKNKVLFDMLAMQEPCLKNMTELLATFPNDSTCARLHRETIALEAVFPTGNLSPTQFKERLIKLRDAVAVLRNKIVQNS
jgi:hypothetical protein